MLTCICQCNSKEVFLPQSSANPSAEGSKGFGMRVAQRLITSSPHMAYLEGGHSTWVSVPVVGIPAWILVVRWLQEGKCRGRAEREMHECSPSFSHPQVEESV